MHEPLLRLDRLGHYVYEHGYCVRDAFAQHFGPEHPLVQAIPRSVRLIELWSLCTQFGLRHSQPGQTEGEIADGQAAIWIIEGDTEETLHAVYSVEPKPILQAGVVIIGYVLVD